MIVILEQAIEALRDELQQYGEMLALLEAQHEIVARRSSGPVLTSIAEVETQRFTIEAARRRRETLQKQLAWALGRPDSDTFRQLLPLVPDEYRPLVAALVEEINELLGRVQGRAEQNRAQLQRAIELMEQFISSLSRQAQSTLSAGEPPALGADESRSRFAAAIVQPSTY